jgi:rubredoxin
VLKGLALSFPFSKAIKAVTGLLPKSRQEDTQHPTPMDLAYRKKIIERLDRQTQKGIDKYGETLDKNSLTFEDRWEYLAEELTDVLVYTEHFITYLRPFGIVIDDLLRHGQIKHECKKCGSWFDAEEVKPLVNAAERLTRFQRIPSGICPNCGELTYMIYVPKEVSEC